MLCTLRSTRERRRRSSSERPPAVVRHEHADCTRASTSGRPMPRLDKNSSRLPSCRRFAMRSRHIDSCQHAATFWLVNSVASASYSTLGVVAG